MEDVIFASSGLAGIRAPDSLIARKAVELARTVSSAVVYNHVMRSYYFGELVAAPDSRRADREIVFVSSVLHDLGITDYARGPRRFEIEGADAARAFAVDHGMSEDKSWLIWDNIALHMLDLNQYKQPEARMVQNGIMADVIGAGLDQIRQEHIDEVLAAFPRLGFKKIWADTLLEEARTKPHSHTMSPVTMLAYHCDCGLHIPNPRTLIECSPLPD